MGVDLSPAARRSVVRNARLGLVMALAVIMMLPPVILNRYFSLGGISGSLTGR